MEFDRDLYQKAFSRIALSDKKREEILHMTEQNEKRRKPIGRRMLVAAVTALLAAVLAMGANAATDGELGEKFFMLVDSITLQETEVRMYVEDAAENGQKIIIKTLTDDPSDDQSEHYASVGIYDDGTEKIKYVALDAKFVNAESDGSKKTVQFVVPENNGTGEYSWDDEEDFEAISYTITFDDTSASLTTSSEPEE